MCETKPQTHGIACKIHKTFTKTVVTNTQGKQLVKSKCLFSLCIIERVFTCSFPFFIKSHNITALKFSTLICNKILKNAPSPNRNKSSWQREPIKPQRSIVVLQIWFLTLILNLLLLLVEISNLRERKRLRERLMQEIRIVHFERVCLCALVCFQPSGDRNKRKPK